MMSTHLGMEVLNRLGITKSREDGTMEVYILVPDHRSFYEVWQKVREREYTHELNKYWLYVLKQLLILKTYSKRQKNRASYTVSCKVLLKRSIVYVPYSLYNTYIRQAVSFFNYVSHAVNKFLCHK